MVSVPLLDAQPLQGADTGVQDITRRVLEPGPGPVVNGEVVVGNEEEAEHVTALAQ